MRVTGSAPAWDFMRFYCFLAWLSASATYMTTWRHLKRSFWGEEGFLSLQWHLTTPIQKIFCLVCCISKDAHSCHFCCRAVLFCN